MGDVFGGFHSHVPTVVLRQFGLIPRLSRVVSAATCPAATLHVNLCPLASGYASHSSPDSSHQFDSGFDGAWFPQVPVVGSEASIFSELSQVPATLLFVNFTSMA